MNYSSFSLFVMVTLLFSSCVSKKQYLEAVGQRLSSEEREKQLNLQLANANSQLRQLTRENGLLEQRITDLETDKNRLKSEITDLRSQVDDITGKSLNEQARLDKALKNKAAELAKREVVINEMRRLMDEKDQTISNIMFRLFDVLGQYGDDEIIIDKRDGEIHLTLTDKLLFRSGSTRVRSKGSQALGNIAKVLMDYQNIQIIVKGHTDDVPIRTDNIRDNWDLSVLRASSVARVLTKDFNINANLVTASGRSEFEPRADNANKAGRAQNRRTEIIIAPHLGEIYNVLRTKS